METISVIVPVYNIEKYIERCVKSIINQTHTSLQIILVDDGSTDSSGKICDKLKNEDARIEVIHKTNGGLSDARNCGIDRAHGKYIAFVDGDDYIDEDIYEILYKVICDYNADIVSCGFYEEFTDKTNIRCYNKETMVLNQLGAYEALFEDKLGISSCNKLFRKEIFSNVRYKCGIQSEDIELLYRALHHVQTVVCANVIKYHYCHRAGSITTKGFNKKSMDILYTLDAVIDFIEQNYPQISSQAYAYQAQWLLNHYRCLYSSGKVNKFIEEKLFIEEKIKDNLKVYLNNKHLWWGNSYLLCSVALHVFPLANWLLEMAVKIKDKLSGG